MPDGQPIVMTTMQEARDNCSGRPACAKPDVKATMTCESCSSGCGTWKLVVKVEGKCNIRYIDPKKIRVQYLPDFSAMLKHEKCHCADFREAFQTVVNEAGAVAYGSQAECDAARKNLDVGARVTELSQDSRKHRGSKWRKGGTCYAVYRW